MRFYVVVDEETEAEEAEVREAVKKGSILRVVSVLDGHDPEGFKTTVIEVETDPAKED